jgi:predicted dehydrogenase
MDRTIAAWLAPEQIPLLREAVRAAELKVVAAGTPVRGQSALVADALGGSPIDDLRAMLSGAEARLVLIAAPDNFGAGPSPDDAGAVRAAHLRGVRIAAMEPIPAAALDLASGGWTGAGEGPRPVEVIRACPLARLSAPFRAATEVLASFGHVRAVCFESWCTPAETSLGALLYGAMDLVHSMLGEPEMIDATYVAPAHGRGVHSLPGESLRGLHGDLTANLRFADGRAASVVLSDHAGRWNRTITLLGPAGRLRMYDDGFEWVSPEGTKADESRQPRRTRGSEPAIPHSAAALADSLARMLDPGVPDPGPADQATLLAMAQAALLSARTIQPESPTTIKQMAGAA